MIQNIKRVLKYLVKRKYLLSIIIFIIWILLFDQNSIVNRIKDAGKLKKLNQEKEYYIDKIKEDSIKLYELKTNDANLEKFAREQYYLKAKDEEIFIIKEK